MKKLFVSGLLVACFACGGNTPKNGKDNSNSNFVSPFTAEFQQIDPASFTAAAGSCGSGIEDGRATLRFVLQADDGAPIQGTDVTLSAEDIRFRDTAIFEVPIVTDDPAMSMARRADDTCSAGQCRQDGMTCEVAPGIADSSDAPRCQRSAAIAIEGDVEFVSDTSKPQLFGVLYENSGSMEGFLPSDVGELHPDWDGDGTAEGSSDVGQIRSRASDVNRQSRAALAVLINNWVSARDNALDTERETEFGLWEFKGTTAADVVSLVEGLTPAGTPWTSNPAVADGARDEFSSAQGTRGNVFMAIHEVLDTGFAPSEYESFDKTLVVFLDGPDDLRLPTFSASTVIERATELGVRIFIVHLDATQIRTTMAGTPVHREDPRYWNEQVDGGQIQDPCSSDTDCKNFEQCRVPVGYSTSPDAPVEISSEGESYCMPARDPNTGRFGPIAEYARIACATEGGYLYVQEATGIRPRMDWLPFAMDGLWEVDTVIDVLQNGDVDSDDTYHFQTTMSVTVGGTERTYDFSQQGEPISTDAGADTRAVLFN